MTAESIITQAREEGPAFTADRHPRRVAVNYLSRLQRRLVEEWMKVDPDAYVETFTVEFPLDDFQAGVELEVGESDPVPIDITQIREPFDLVLRRHLDQPLDLHLISWRDRNRSPIVRACYIQNNTLYFTGRENQWNDVAEVRFVYTATAPDITSLREALLLPPSAEETLVAWLAYFFAKRTAEAELTRSRNEYKVDAMDAEAMWLSGLRRKRGAISSRTRSVW